MLASAVGWHDSYQWQIMHCHIIEHGAAVGELRDLQQGKGKFMYEASRGPNRLEEAYSVGPEEHGTEEASVYGGLVHHEGVLLVVPAIAGNGHNRVLPSGQLPAPENDP